MWAPSHWVIVILSQSVEEEIQEHEKPSFCFFPTASSCTLQCFSLRTKAPLTASHVSVGVQRPGCLKRSISRSRTCGCLESVQFWKDLHFQTYWWNSSYHDPVLIWIMFSRTFRLWVAKQDQVVLIDTTEFTVASVEGSGILISQTLHLSFSMEIQSAWKLASKSPSFLKPCLPYCEEVGAGDFKVFDGHKVLWL